MRRAVAAFVGAAAVVAGCGGGTSSSDQIKTVIHAYYEALANGDSAAACDQLANDTVTSIEKLAKGRACKDVINDQLQQPDYARVVDKLKKAKISKVTVANDKAIAQTDVPGVGGRSAPVKVFLKKEGNSWKIVSEPRSQQR